MTEDRPEKPSPFFLPLSEESPKVATIPLPALGGYSGMRGAAAVMSATGSMYGVPTVPARASVVMGVNWTPVVQPVASGVVAAVGSLGQSIAAEPTRAAFAEGVRRSRSAPVTNPDIDDDLRAKLTDLVDALREAKDERKSPANQRSSLAEALTIIGFPLVVGEGVWALYVAFEDDPQAAVWRVALMLITAILMNYFRQGPGKG